MKLLRSVYWLPVLCLAAASAPEPSNLLPNGSFEEQDRPGAPAHWQWSASENVSIRDEGGNRFLRITDTRDDRGKFTVQRVDLDPSWKAVRVAARMRASGLKLGDAGHEDARIALQFDDAAGTRVAYGPSLSLKADSAWTDIARVGEVPAGATVLVVQPILLADAGTFDVDDITVTPVPAGYVEPVAAAAPADAVEPAAVELSATRGEMSLAGPWKFQPASGSAAPAGPWGWIKVPGSWMRGADVLAPGTGGAWTGFDGRALRGAWYERRVTVPRGWAGRRIVLDLHRVSTDATVFVGDREVGRVGWPEGLVDLTDVLRPGESADIRILVVATPEPGEALVLMGDAPGQVYREPSKLASAGLIGEVTLRSEPRALRVEDLVIQTSVREKQVTLDMDVVGANRGGRAVVTATMLDAEGAEAKRFESAVQLTGRPSERVRVAWPWADARLWDLGQPNLYTLRLKVEAADGADEVAERFGFREFWIDGRDFVLNGIPIRLRPNLSSDSRGENVRERVAHHLSRGFNFVELWPNDTEARGTGSDFAEWYAAADEAGLPISGVMPHIGWMGSKVETPEGLARHRDAAERVLRRHRNHPSIVMWGTSGNAFGGALDPNVVAQRQAAGDFRRTLDAGSPRMVGRAEQALDAIRAADGTRPIFIHNGGEVGDVYTVNFYLNMTPLREREAWLSEYRARGDMPLMYVEFGTPLYSTFMRGRHGYGPTAVSEPLVTEHVASYLGPRAYATESAEYRGEIARRFKQDQTYENWHANQVLQSSPAFQEFMALFNERTWRTWRTMGITGGMIPWDGGYALVGKGPTPAGIALDAANGPTLAWIAGGDSPDTFLDGTHHYRPGEAVRKQAVIINDGRAPAEYELTWRATVGGREVGVGSHAGGLKVAETAYVPFAFEAPAADSDADGVVELRATIGGREHADRFAFRVYAKRDAKLPREVLLVDPVGKTSAMLKSLGVATRSWDGEPGDGVLVIGREAMSSGALPGDLGAFVEAGGRVLLMQQQPEFIRQALEFRVSRHASRRVFPVPHAAVGSTFDDVDLRDWAGAGTLLPPRTNALQLPANLIRSRGRPMYGWRWGNDGTVTSGAVEKPHRAGWRPLMECEFDLAYSPLMELDYGRGRITWCQLDLEDQVEHDPAARRVAERLLEHVETSPLAPRAGRTVYVGDDAGQSLLDGLGLRYERAEAVPNDAQLLVVGAGAAANADAIESFAAAGGRVLVLAQAPGTSVLGVEYAQVDRHEGSLQVPGWPEAAGLSASDLRLRSAAPHAVLSGDAEIASDGLLARKELTGGGTVVLTAIDPSALGADERSYLRFTRWRQTRALAQLLANLGGSFELDGRIFEPRAIRGQDEARVSLAREWRVAQLRRLDGAPSPSQAHEDPGVSAQATALLTGKPADVRWRTAKMPQQLEALGGPFEAADGESVLVTTVDVPESLRGLDLVLSLGAVDDYDETYFNGTRVGSTDRTASDPWSKKRSYPVPASLVRPTGNVIAVRVWDRFGGGGFTGSADELQLAPEATEEPIPEGLYHPDYRTDFELGDEPARYYNW